MKKVTLLCGLLLAVSASIASAAPGVGLRWNSCIGDAGAANKNFACTSNAGTNILVGTFELGATGLLETSGNEVVIDIAAAGASLPAWWDLKNATACRPLSLGMTFTNAAAVNCTEWAQGQSSGGIGAYAVGGRGPNTARIVAAIAVPPNALQNLDGGLEYFAFNITVGNQKTVGTPSCAGCLTPVCIVFNSINLTTPVLANNIKLSGASNGTDANFCTWQGGAGVVVGAATGCPAATPTNNKTWGQVKSMYHN